METVVVRRSMKAYSWGVVAGAVAVLTSQQLGTSRGASFALGLLIAVGPAAVGLLRAALGQDAVIRIDEAGIIDYRIHDGSIPWGQITYVERSRNRLYLTIENPEALGLTKSLRYRLNQPIGRGGEMFRAVVQLRNLDVPPDTIVDAVRARVNAPVIGASVPAN